jgi:arginine-tRNA-protein transferase
MRHSLPKAPQFYVTAPQECPYLENKVERKLFTSLNGFEAQILNNALSTQGFRRSQNVLYRPSCSECSACLSARIPVANFSLTKSEKRVVKRNKRLIRNIKSPWATSEQFELFTKYVKSRHEKGGMSAMTETEFASMVEETCVKTILVEYSIQDEGTNQIQAVSITDVIEDGLSMVYSFYEPTLSELSLGKYMILDHIDLSREMNLPYLYLGYWVKGSKKMDYKAQYSPIELFSNGKWSLQDRDEISKNGPKETYPDTEPTSNTIYLPTGGS